MKPQASKSSAKSTASATGNRSTAAASPSAPAKGKPVPTPAPTADAIRKRAYEIYLGRRTTGAPGSPESDWKQAERELAAG